MKDDFKIHLLELSENQTTEDSSSPYASPCFVKRKNTGKLRLFNDFRKHNRASTTVEYYFPTINDSFLKIKGSKVFSKLELKRGFYKLKNLRSDRLERAFTTPFGKYQFNRVPFGLKKSLKYFHSVTSKILSEFPNVIVFVDDPHF